MFWKMKLLALPKASLENKSFKIIATDIVTSKSKPCAPRILNQIM